MDHNTPQNSEQGPNTPDPKTEQYAQSLLEELNRPDETLNSLANNERTADQLLVPITEHRALTKEKQEQLADHLVQALLNDGNGDPLVDYILLKAAKAVLDKMVTTMQEEAISSAECLDGKGAGSWRGVSFQVANSADTYDFSDDYQWALISQDVKKAKEVLAGYQAALKRREQFLVSLTQPLADMVTGVIIHPPEKLAYGERQIRITFPKK